MFIKIFTTSIIFFLIVCCLCGIIFVTINITRLNLAPPKTQIIYRYMPKTFEEEQNELCSDVINLIDENPDKAVDKIIAM